MSSKSALFVFELTCYMWKSFVPTSAYVSSVTVAGLWFCLFFLFTLVAWSCLEVWLFTWVIFIFLSVWHVKLTTNSEPLQSVLVKPKGQCWVRRKCNSLNQRAFLLVHSRCSLATKALHNNSEWKLLPRVFLLAICNKLKSTDYNSTLNSVDPPFKKKKILLKSKPALRQCSNFTPTTSLSRQSMCLKRLFLYVHAVLSQKTPRMFVNNSNLGFYFAYFAPFFFS